MIHRVYVRSNMNSPFVVQDYDPLEGSNNNTNIFSCSSKKQVHFQEGKHCWLLDHLFLHCLWLVLIFCRIVLTYIMCIWIMESTCLLKFLCEMTCQKLENMVTFLLTIISVPFVFATSFSFMLCRISFKHNRRRGRLFVKKGRMMRT